MVIEQRPIPRKSSKAHHIVGLFIAAPPLALGSFVAYEILWPGICGDYSGAVAFPLLGCWVLNVPMGMVLAGAGFFSKRSPSQIRMQNIVIGLSILALPFVDTALLRFKCH